MNTEVTALGYIVVTAADLAKWSRFATEVLGTQVATQPTASPNVETLFLRMDDRSWRIAVQQGEDEGLAALGLEVADRASFDALRTRLTSAGFAVKDAPDVALERRVTEVFQLADPAGNPLEFFYGQKLEQQHFVSPTATRFVTGTMGFGHVVLMGGDGDEMYEFYVKVLGFRVSDVIMFGPVAKAIFTSPSPRHHSVAFTVFPGDGPSGLDHIMLQVEDIDMVGRALDRVYDGEATIHTGLGRHTNDHMISFYCFSPSGLRVEYGYAGREIDNAEHRTAYYDAASSWGHRLPDGSDPFREMVHAMEQENVRGGSSSA